MCNVEVDPRLLLLQQTFISDLLNRTSEIREPLKTFLICAQVQGCLRILASINLPDFAEVDGLDISDAAY